MNVLLNSDNLSTTSGFHLKKPDAVARSTQNGGHNKGDTAPIRLVERIFFQKFHSDLYTLVV